MGTIDTLSLDLARRFQVPQATARAAVCLVVRAHQGDSSAGASVTGMAHASPGAAALLAAALRSLQASPIFWTAHYATQARSQSRAVTSGRAFITGDLFGDIAHSAEQLVKPVLQTVTNPGKALADVMRDPFGSLGNAVEQAINIAVPLDLLKPIPGVGDLAQIAKSFNPLSNLGKLARAGLHGDMPGVMGVVKNELSNLQTVSALVPGLGTGVSTAIGLAEALVNGGKPLEIAIRAAYGAIPIPPGIRQVTDVVLDTIIALINGGSVTDMALSVARDRVPEGVPRDVFDTLAQIVVRHKPIASAAGELAAHEALKLAQGVGPALVQGLAKSVPPGVAGLLSKLPDPSKALPGLPSNLLGVAGLLGKLPPAVAQKAAAPVAALVKSMPRAAPRPAAPPPPPQKKIALRLPAKGAAPARTVALALGPSSSAALLTANAPYDMFAQG